MRKIHSKLKELEWSQHFSHYKLMGIFQTLKGRLLISPSSDPAEFRTHPNIMGLLVACKNEEDPIKNEGARVVTTLFINFSDTQGQLTPKSAMRSCQNSKLSKL